MMESRPMEIIWEKTKEETIRVLRVYGIEPQLFLPEKINGMPVTEIGDYCFSKSARLPEHYEKTIVMEHGDTMVEQTTGMTELAGDFLQQVTLPDSIRKIGNLAFYNCRNLTRVAIGKHMEMLGSDAFMNCRALREVCFRCSYREESGIRSLLHQISWQVTVVFEKEEQVEAVVVYPEYYESLDEIAPAHLFHRNIEGEGFRARQCIKDGKIDFEQYDEIFVKACAEEDAETLQKMVCARLCYPVMLTQIARNRYETYAKTHLKEMIQTFMKERDLETVTFFANQGYLDASSIEAGVEMALSMEWAEGVAMMIALKQKMQKTKKERYSFDEF